MKALQCIKNKKHKPKQANKRNTPQTTTPEWHKCFADSLFCGELTTTVLSQA